MPLRFRTYVGREIPGGFHFPLKDGPILKSDKGVVSEAIDDLVRQVQEYRVNNGRPAGDPLPDIIAYYAKTYPFSVENTDTEPETPEGTLEDDVMQWVNSVWRSPPKVLLEPDIANHRYDACLKCPLRVILAPPAHSKASEDTDIPPTGPELARKESDRRVFLLAKASPVPRDAGLCSLNRWDNRLSCLLPDCKCPRWPKDYS